MVLKDGLFVGLFFAACVLLLVCAIRIAEKILQRIGFFKWLDNLIDAVMQKFQKAKKS